MKYEVKFITAGTYQLFTRHSMYDSTTGVGTVGNEDSVYLSPAFNKNSSTDWVGFEGLEFDENDITGNVDIPSPGDAMDPDGWKPGTANSPNDGWYALRDWGVKDAGVVNGTTDPAFFSGKFNWYNRPAFVSTGTNGGFDGEYGFKTEYTVTPAMVGQALTFEMSTREPYGVFDGFLFIQTSNIYPDMDLLDLDPTNGMPAFSRARGAVPVLGAVPEPTTLLLFAMGIAAFQVARRRRRC